MPKSHSNSQVENEPTTPRIKKKMNNRQKQFAKHKTKDLPTSHEHVQL